MKYIFTTFFTLLFRLYKIHTFPVGVVYVVNKLFPRLWFTYIESWRPALAQRWFTVRPIEIYLVCSVVRPSFSCFLWEGGGGSENGGAKKTGNDVVH